MPCQPPALADALLEANRRPSARGKSGGRSFAWEKLNQCTSELDRPPKNLAFRSNFPCLGFFSREPASKLHALGVGTQDLEENWPSSKRERFQETDSNSSSNKLIFRSRVPSEFAEVGGADEDIHGYPKIESHQQV